ncbi:MAG: ABC transporter ATP-binding protein [Dehalococcoidia bacterium]
MSIVETTGLTKTYNDLVAVNQLNLQVEEGEIFGFLGPNGAGKTTTILMLLGLSQPTSGSARIGGYDSTRESLKVRRITGYLPENIGFYGDLTARENLRYTARLNGIADKQSSARIDEALKKVGLAQVSDKRVDTFSRGMKQRLGIADVLIKEPRVVFLDEPTLGLDPEGVNQALDMIASMSREQGITIIVSSHLLHQVQKVCHRVGIIARGHLVAEGPIERLGRETLGGAEGGYTLEDIYMKYFREE